MGRYNCLFNLGTTHRRLGNLDKSAAFLKEAFSEMPESPALFNNYGMTEFERGEFENAIGNFDKAVEFSKRADKVNKEPNHTYLNNRGLAFYFTKYFTHAIEDYTHALRLDDSDPTIWFNRGNARLALNTENDIEQAI